MLFILVQVQAGPPAFAREASARLPAEAFGEGGLVTASYGWQATFALTGYAWRSHARPAGKACPA
jgi:hypothetical protein